MTLRIVALAALLAMTGCNTVAGVGQDVTAGADMVGGWFR